MYRITITKIEPNPKYDPKSSGPRRHYDSEPDPETVPRNLEVVALVCEIESEQFKAIRKACLEQM